MQEKHIKIVGMHCRSCEVVLGGAIKLLPGVRSVDMSFKHGKAHIRYEGVLPEAELEKIVTEAGYSLEGQEKKTVKLDNYIYGAALVYIVYLLYKLTPLSRVDVNNFGGGALLPLFVGLVAGISTCMALVGGLVLAISSGSKSGIPMQTHLAFNVGRVVGFFLLGGLIGALGGYITFGAGTLGLLTLFSGAIMLILSLRMLDINVPMPTLPTFAWVSKVSQKEKSDGGFGVLLLGAATFFLPCGFTQAMQVYAIGTQSFGGGALAMGLFALGTTPGLLGVGALGRWNKSQKAKVFTYAIGMAVLLFGFSSVQNGLNIVVPSIASNDNSSSGENVSQVDENDLPLIRDGKQIIEMTQNAYGYEPASFVVRAGVPVRWEIKSKTEFSCASFVVIPELKIQARLTKGANVVEFTPTKEGVLRFSCAMGMYGGQFIVVK